VPSDFEPAYAYARACGSLARSFLGDRAVALARSARVGEAWRSIFAESPPALPEAELAVSAERGVRTRALRALRSIGGTLVAESPFFAALARKAEFSYLKALLSGIAEGAPEAPARDEAEPEFDFSAQAYPDLDRMLRRTRYQWVIETGVEELPALKNRLDRQYYSELWASIGSIPPAMRGTIPELIRVEAELENLVWALRLKRYYAMGASEIQSLLIELPGTEVRKQALRAASLRVDSRSEWVGWKWERLLPDSRREDGGEWYLDVCGFESAARGYLFRRLYRRLHLEVESFVPLYCYFRIKEYESIAIRGIIEGINLEAPPAEIGAFAAETTGGAA
jgi:hypothetical protein